MVEWLSSCVVEWLSSCVVEWLSSRVVGWLSGCVIGWLGVKPLDGHHPLASLEGKLDRVSEAGAERGVLSLRIFRFRLFPLHA